MKALFQNSVFKYSLLTLIIIMSILAFILYIILQYNNGYHKLLKERDQLFKYVKPNKNYIYWAYISVDASAKTLKTIYQQGHLPPNLKIKPLKRPLFGLNVFAPVYKCVVYLDNGKLKEISDQHSFETFIGNIDNMQEALLIAYSLGYRYTDEYGTGYRKINKTYEFVLTHFTTCPRTKETTYLKFGKYGLEKIVKMHTEYFKDCIFF